MSCSPIPRIDNHILLNYATNRSMKDVGGSTIGDVDYCNEETSKFWEKKSMAESSKYLKGIVWDWTGAYSNGTFNRKWGLEESSIRLDFKIWLQTFQTCIARSIWNLW